MFNKSFHLTDGLMTPRLAACAPATPVETFTSPVADC